MLKKGYVRNLIQYLLIAAGIIIAFFVTRLVNLTIIPIFTDEAIYLRWAQIAAGDPRWRFISLIDGKQPLLIWLLIPFFKFRIFSDPLIAGRFFSVLMGFVALVGMSVLGGYVTKSLKGSVIGALLYVIIPFFLMYDRFAIYEALLVAITVWTLFLSYLFGKTLRLDVALLLGTMAGFGLLTKSSALFTLLLLPLTLLLVDWRTDYRNKLFKWAGLMFVVIVQSQIYANILRLSEFSHYVGEKNLQFIYNASEFITNPLKSFYGNLWGQTVWLTDYLTPLLLLFVVLSIIWLMRYKWKEAVFFVGWFIIPYLALAFFGKVLYPRFLVFMVPSLLIPVIMFINFLIKKIKKRELLLILALIIFIPMLYFNVKVLTDPIHAPIPGADYQGFINDWPAGYGIKEVVAYIEQEAQSGPIVVGTEGTFGLFPMALELYLGSNVNVTFKAQWPLDEFPHELVNDAQSVPTYLVFKERQTAPEDWPIELVAEYQRGEGPTYLKFYRVLP